MSKKDIQHYKKHPAGWVYRFFGAELTEIQIDLMERLHVEEKSTSPLKNKGHFAFKLVGAHYSDNMMLIVDEASF